MLKFIPNILTILRFILIPFIVIAICFDKYIAAIVLLVISGLTDVLDGTIARKFNLISNFGKLMDPLADKLTQLSALITIVCKNIIPLWILLIFAFKEIVMICGASFLYGKNLIVSSKWFGKLSTVILYVAIICSMIIIQFNLPSIYKDYTAYLYYLALITTLFSLVMYFKTFFNKELIQDSINNTNDN